MGNRSYRQFGPDGAKNSTENQAESFSPIAQPNLFQVKHLNGPGSANDSSAIRETLVQAIKRSGKSREAIADDMSYLAGTKVTVRQINAFTAESKEDYRFPLELARAFCAATDDYTLLHRIAEAAGFQLIEEQEAALLQLGREYLKQKRASEQVSLLEERLRRVELV